jgi:hypothetical protein
MERDLWRNIVQAVREVSSGTATGRYTFSDADVLCTYFWAVMHNKPISWACEPSHWPLVYRKRPHPTPSTMSRRLRRPQFQQQLEQLEGRLKTHWPNGLVQVIDGKPLPVGGNSSDPDASYGRAAGGVACGYKLHAIYGTNGAPVVWEVQPLNVDERVVARSLIARSDSGGYLLGDKHYDANELYDLAAQHGMQMVVARVRGPHCALGHRAQSPGRLRSKDLLEDSHTGFGPALYKRRTDIERFFGVLTTPWYGLSPLPAYVRRLPCVRRWVQAKLIIYMITRLTRDKAG